MESGLGGTLGLDHGTGHGLLGGWGLDCKHQESIAISDSDVQPKLASQAGRLSSSSFRKYIQYQGFAGRHRPDY